MKFTNVICVCSSSHLKVWKLTSKNVIKFIDSKKYTVIVPKNDLNLFKINSPIEFNIESEEKYSSSFINILIKKTINSKTRFNWYLQQFLKLSAISEILDNEIFLIWDADTVPLKKLTFKQNNKIGIYKSDEFHKVYFDHLNILLGLKKNNDFSYISQCMPVKSKWFKSLKKSIENINKKEWYSAIIETIDFYKANAFSEYEMIGTYVEKNFPDEIEILDNKWLRYGKRMIGSVDNLKYTNKLLSLKYDYITFENWDKFSSKSFINDFLLK